MNNPSPFSRENGYIPVKVGRNPIILHLLTPREMILLNFIKSCGTVAGFQVENLWPSNGRKRLKKLATKGIVVRHSLEGRHKLNAYNLDTRLELDRALRQMAFAQLYLRIREVTPCMAAVVPAPLTGMLKFNSKLFPVVVLRKEDRIPVLRGLPGLLVVSEERDVALPGVDYRLTTDMDLLHRPMNKVFYRPDGSPDPLVPCTA